MILAVVEATTARAKELPSNATRIQFQGTAELNQASESDSIFPRPPYMQSRWIVTR